MYVQHSKQFYYSITWIFSIPTFYPQNICCCHRRRHIVSRYTDWVSSFPGRLLPSVLFLHSDGRCMFGNDSFSLNDPLLHRCHTLLPSLQSYCWSVLGCLFEPVIPKDLNLACTVSWPSQLGHHHQPPLPNLENSCRVCSELLIPSSAPSPRPFWSLCPPSINVFGCQTIECQKSTCLAASHSMHFRIYTAEPTDVFRLYSYIIKKMALFRTKVNFTFMF